VLTRKSYRFGQTRIIIDRHRRLNPDPIISPAIDTSINKEAEGRAILFSDETPSGLFCDFGSGEADLTYLLGISGNFAIDPCAEENRLRFSRKFRYCGIELNANPAKNVVAGDLCSERFEIEQASLIGCCAVVYSNNVFEHLRRPWIAARNAIELLVPGGVGLIIVPFSQRYHESPSDYFRFTHKGLEAIFSDAGRIQVMRSGYDILGRRNDWQGAGHENDVVPVDEFGSWRETWFSFLAFKRVGG
jgi:hypothetical protein